MWVDDDGNPADDPPLVEELRWEDFVGFGFMIVGEIAEAIERGLKAVGGQFFAGARWKRERLEEKRKLDLDRLEFDSIIARPTLPEEPS